VGFDAGGDGSRAGGGCLVDFGSETEGTGRSVGRSVSTQLSVRCELAPTLLALVDAVQRHVRVVLLRQAYQREEHVELAPSQSRAFLSGLRYHFEYLGLHITRHPAAGQELLRTVNADEDVPARSPDSMRASNASTYSGTSTAGRSDFTREPRAAFFGVGKSHGESLPPSSSANKPLPAGFASSSKSEDDCFARAGTSSSPNKDMVTSHVICIWSRCGHASCSYNEGCCRGRYQTDGRST
jgi:hypothetical protein